MWGHLFLLLSALITAYIFLYRYPSNQNKIKIVGLAALACWIPGNAEWMFDFPSVQPVRELLLIMALALVLVKFLMIIRHLRPVFFRYPRFVVYVPLFIPVALALVLDIRVIKQLIFIATEGVGIIVSGLLLAGYRDDIHKGRSLTGILAVATAFAGFWLLPEEINIAPVVWQFLVAIGIPILAYSFSDILAAGEQNE